MKSITSIALVLLLAVGLVSAGGGDRILDDRTVENVEASFDALTHMGEWLGFNMGDAPVTHPGTSLPPGSGRPTDRHIQGIARSPRSDPYPVFYVTRSGYVYEYGQKASLMVVRMYTRDTDGERLRSNRLSTAAGLPNHAETISTPPEWVDRVVKNIEYRTWSHPGDVAMAGDILAVAMEKSVYSSYPDGTIIFYDCSDPLDPKKLAYELRLDVKLRYNYQWLGYDWPESKAGTLAFTRLPGGTYLLAVTAGDGDWMEFYYSNDEFFNADGTENEDFELFPHTRLGRGSMEDIDHWVIDDGDRDTIDDKPFQGMNFIQQSNGGPLYLIAGRHTNGWAPQWLPYTSSDDILYLFKVTGTDGTFGDLDLEYVKHKKVRMRSGGGAKWTPIGAEPGLLLFYPSEPAPTMQIEARMQANFLAGCGSYVSPTGELIYYATHHYNIAPGLDDKGSVSFAELRHNKVAHTGTCGPQFRAEHLGGPYRIPEASTLELDGTVYHVEPWVQMFQDKDFKGISWMVDWRDQDEDWYDDFDKLDGYTFECLRYDFWNPRARDGVNDCMDSFRWCGQTGSRLKIFKKKDFEDLKRDHLGNGAVQEFSEVGKFGDDATSVRIYWDGPSPAPYEWDMDDDGEFDDAFQAKAVFQAGVGSSDNTVHMKYWHDWDETASTVVSAEIEVYNVPPVIEDLEIDDDTPAEGQTVEVTGRWTDPGATECRVTVDWGDGSSDEDPDNHGSFAFTHEYGDNGFYPIEVCVSDQEDTVCGSLSTTAYNVDPTAVIDSIDQPNPFFILPVVHLLTYNGSLTDPGWLDTHTSSWDYGDGDDAPGTVVEENDPPDATGTTVAEHVYGDPGIYDILLTVTDDDGGIGTATDEVTVLTAVEAVRVLQAYIHELPDEAFKKPPVPRRAILIRKLDEVIRMIEAANYHAAIAKLRKDVRAKADGCLGAHPNNDWVLACPAQEDIFLMIRDLVRYLTYLNTPPPPDPYPEPGAGDAPAPPLSRGVVRRF